MRSMLLPALGAALLISSVPAAASAALLSFDLGFEFSGGTDPAGPSPWATATFDDDTGNPNTVDVTLSTAGLVADEFISNWVFNFDPALDPTLLTFAVVDNSASAAGVNFGVDAFKPDGDGFFDIEFDFPPPPGNFAAKFTTGEQVIYTLIYTSPIDVSSFDFFSAPPPGGGPGPFQTAAHVQGIGPTGSDSGWVSEVPVPEPSTALLLLAPGLLALGALRRSRLTD